MVGGLLIIFQLLYAIISTTEIICRGEVFFFEGGPKGQLSPRGGATVNHRWFGGELLYPSQENCPYVATDKNNVYNYINHDSLFQMCDILSNLRIFLCIFRTKRYFYNNFIRLILDIIFYGILCTLVCKSYVCLCSLLRCSLFIIKVERGGRLWTTKTKKCTQ